jgi:hypothetical protein
MNKKMLVLFAAEVAAVAILRVAYMVRRDKLWLPKSGKVKRIRKTPVFHNPPKNAWERGKPSKYKSFENQARTEHIEGWTIHKGDSKLHGGPDSPD